MHKNAPRLTILVLFLVLTVLSTALMYTKMRSYNFNAASGLVGAAMMAVGRVSAATQQQQQSGGGDGGGGVVDSSSGPTWAAPKSSWINQLPEVINGTGVHGFIFNGSHTPQGVSYGTYNWCNMPHVRAQEYPRVDKQFELQYVEVIQRHHKRTPYADNTFPQETYRWDCSDQGLFYYGQPLGQGARDSAQTYWSVVESEVNPFVAKGFNGTCQFPQITREGLDDAWQHGKDLYGVYHDLLHFLPGQLDEDKVAFRVTSNVITSQVASALIKGMYDTDGPVPLQIQRDPADSLQPTYSCPAGSNLFSSYSTGSSDKAWLEHLQLSAGLYSALDAISGVPTSDSGWHRNWDHYYDNLSARQCHGKPLPCAASGSGTCVTQTQAETVYRLGQYEYSYIYRDRQESFDASMGTFGVWFAELAASLRAKMSGKSEALYKHNVAHDGSMARLLSILQLDEMVWPGMGSEVVFELYKSVERGNATKWYIRVLWSGQVLQSSSPVLGKLNLIDAEVFLGYVEGLVGQRAEKVVAFCSQ